MPVERQRDPYIEELRTDAPVFEVAPVRRRTRVPRLALVALAVGIGAFVAGIGVASAGPVARVTPSDPRPTASPTSADAAGSPSAAPTTAPRPAAGGPTPGPSPVPPGGSPFLDGFDPVAIVAGLPGGESCTPGEQLDKEVPRTRRDGPRITFQRSWLTWCPVPEARRQAFLLDTFEALVEAIPAETFGYSAGGAGIGDALYPYAQPPLAGTVALTAGPAGTGLAISVVVHEWRVDQAR